jgi:hypothetical protein
MKEKRMRLLERNKILIFSISIGIFVLNIIQGSSLNFISDACNPITLEFGFFIISLITIIVLALIKKRQSIKMFLIPILFASAIVCLIEPYIFEYQIQCTNRNLETTCSSIAKYKSKNGRLPNKLTDLTERKNQNTGFKIFNDNFQYKKETNDSFKILYKVKFGKTCEAWNCSTFFANMEFTCHYCGSVENSYLEK